MAFMANTDNMATLVTTLGNASRQIEDRLVQLQKYADGLASTWTGPAAEAYATQKGNWDRAANDMNLLLGQFGLHLNNITDSIVSTERAATQRWSTMGS
jgi:WXG100 family type VII secretion target